MGYTLLIGVTKHVIIDSSTDCVCGNIRKEILRPVTGPYEVSLNTQTSVSSVLEQKGSPFYGPAKRCAVYILISRCKKYSQKLIYTPTSHTKRYRDTSPVQVNWRMRHTTDSCEELN